MGQYFTLTVIMHGSAMSSKPGRMKDDALYLRLKETSFPIFHSILTKKGKKEGRKEGNANDVRYFRDLAEPSLSWPLMDAPRT